MSSGIVSEVIFNCPFPRDRTALITNYGTQGIPVSTFKANQVKFPTYITSFRSGPSYERSRQNGGRPQGEPLYETIVADAVADTGHAFSLDKTELFSSAVRVSGSAYSIARSGAYQVQSGVNSLWWMDATNAPVPFDPQTFGFRSDDNALKRMGTDFIRATNPLKSKADLLVSVAELLREGFPRMITKAILDPSLKKGRKQRISAVGSEYLNIVFGYKPIISDIVKVYDAMSQIDSMVEQWIRDSGKSVRRRRLVSLDSRFTDLNGDVPIATGTHGMIYKPSSVATEPYSSSAFGSSATRKGHYSRQGQIEVSENISFAGRFTYDLSKLRLLNVFSDDESIVDTNVGLRQYLGLHAVGLSPTDASFVTGWNLIPFSWLVDWFANVGELFDNVRAEQTAGLQLDYAYITSVAKRTVFYNMSHTLAGEYSITSKVFARQKSMRRLKATPFGFDVSFDALSGNQQAILAALAATKTTN